MKVFFFYKFRITSTVINYLSNIQLIFSGVNAHQLVVIYFLLMYIIAILIWYWFILKLNNLFFLKQNKIFCLTIYQIKGMQNIEAVVYVILIVSGEYNGKRKIIIDIVIASYQKLFDFIFKFYLNDINLFLNSTLISNM